MNNLKEKFKHTIILKEVENDIVLCDRDFEPHCGYMSFKEISILQNIVEEIKGKWLEIGSHTGWSGAHVAEKCDEIYLVDPQYNNIKFKERTIENLKMCEIYNKCKLYATDNYFDSNNNFFDGIIIDGNHDSPYPLMDAISADKIINENGCIFFHDYNGNPIKDAVDFLHKKNYEITTFNSINGIAICRKILK